MKTVWSCQLVKTTLIRSTVSHNGSRRLMLFHCSNLTLPPVAQATALMQEMDTHCAHRLAYHRLLTVVHQAAWHLLKQGKKLELMMIWSLLHAEQAKSTLKHTMLPWHCAFLCYFSSVLNFQDITVRGWCIIKSSGIRIKDDWWGKLRRKGKSLVLCGSSFCHSVFHVRRFWQSGLFLQACSSKTFCKWEISLFLTRPLPNEIRVFM